MSFDDLVGKMAIPIDSDDYVKLGQELQQFDPRYTIPSIAGLLTVPEYHAATVRIEVLLHLAVLNCEGKKRPQKANFARWLQITMTKLLSLPKISSGLKTGVLIISEC